MPEHVQVNMLGPCDVRARLRLSHWGTPAIEGVGPGRCLAPTAHRTPPETTRPSVCRAGVGDLLSLRKRQPACGGSEAQGERQGRAPDRGPQPSPAAQSGPVLTPAHPLLRAGGGAGHGAPGTAGHPGGGDEQEEAQATGHLGRPGTRRGGGDAGPPPDIGAALGRTQGPGRGAWRRRAALRAPSPGRGRATPPTATQRPWGRFRRENAGCRSPRPGVLVPLGEGRGDWVRGGGLRGAEAEEAE